MLLVQSPFLPRKNLEKISCSVAGENHFAFKTFSSAMSLEISVAVNAKERKQLHLNNHI